MGGGEDEKQGEGACGGRRGRAEGREKEEEETTLVLPCGLFSFAAHQRARLHCTDEKKHLLAPSSSFARRGAGKRIRGFSDSTRSRGVARPRSRGVWGVSSRRIASVAYLARALEHLRSGARPERLHAAGPVDGPERLQRALAPVRPHARLPHLERHAERRRLHALDETADGEVNGRHGRRDEKSRSGGGGGGGARATRASAGARPNASKLFVEQSSKKVRENIRAVIRRGAR